MIFRPAGVLRTPVKVFLDDQEVGQFIPERRWQEFTFAGRPNPQDGYSVLRFKSTTFNPAQLQLSADNRDLGFLIDTVRIE